MMKVKTPSIGLFLLLMLVFSSFFAQAQTVSLIGRQSCVGDTVSIPIRLSGGPAIAGISLNLSLPTAGLTYLGVDSLDARLGSAQIAYSAVDSNWSFGWFNLSTTQISGTICRLRFLAITPILDTLTWVTSSCQLTGAFFAPIQGTVYQNGRVEVFPTGPNPTISATICQGQSYSVGNQNFTNTGTHQVRLTNQWGCDSIVTLQLTVLPYNSMGTFNGNSTASGLITVNSNLGGTPNIISSIGVVPGNIGDTVLVPVSISMAPGVSVSALSLAMVYDPTKLQCISTLNSINSNLVGVQSNCGVFGGFSQFRAAWFNMNPIAFNGTIFNVQFIILDEGTHHLEWDLVTSGNCEYSDELFDVIPNNFWNQGAVIAGPLNNNPSTSQCDLSLSMTNGLQWQSTSLNQAIIPIVYDAQGATGATFTGLPPGVSGVWANNSAIISGVPSGVGAFPFSINLTGLTCLGAINNQSVCIGQPIQNISLITNGATGIVASGLPAGVTATWANNLVSISGTPTVPGTYTYTITMTGGCVGNNNSRTGNLTVNPFNTIIRQTGTGLASVCVEQTMIPIEYTTTGATDAIVTGLPPGITGEWLNGTYTISGSTSLTGTFPYTVKLLGGCPGGLDSMNDVLEVLPNKSASIQASICDGQSYAFGNQSLNQIGVYSRTIVAANGCDSVITLTLDVEPIDTTYLGIGSAHLVYNNDFQTNTLGWNTSQMHWWNGSQMLGAFSNANIEFQQTNLPNHDSLFVEFDLYMHDTWDNNEPFQVSLNGQVLGTYYFGSGNYSSYPEFTPLGQYGNRCYPWWWGGATTWAYRVRYKVPHTSSTMNFGINVWGAQDPCDESWSIDNFQVETNSSFFRICEGTSLTVGNQVLTNAGHYEILVPSSAGCDSLVIVNLALKPRSDTTRLYRMLCAGETLQYQSQGIQNQGVYYFVLTNALGCDSVVEYTVDTMPASLIVQANGSCIGASLIVNPTVPDWTKIEWKRGTDVIKRSSRGYQANPTWMANSSHPAGIFYHQGTGAVYVVEHGNHRVVRWLPGASSPQVVAGGNGAGSGSNQLHSPYDVFVSPGGSVYVSDYNNARVQRWDPGASFGITVAGGNGSGSANSQLYQPYGIWVDAQSRVFVADYGNNRIVRWDQGATNGVVYRVVQSPTDLLFDQNGYFYSTQYNLNTVLRWAPGSNQSVVAAVAPNPQQISVDLSGDLWVTQYGSNRISRFGFESSREIPLQLNISCNPYGVAITDSGTLYISSHHCGQNISRYSPEVSSILDTLITEFSGIYHANMSRPNGCTLTSAFHAINGTLVDIKGPPIHELCQGDTLLLESTLLRYDLHFQWLRNGQAISGAQQSFLRVVQAGDYQLQVTDSSGCQILSNKWVIMGQGVYQMSSTCPSNVLKIESQASNIRSIQWFRNDTLVQTDHVNYQAPIHRGSTNYGAKGIFVDSHGFVYVADTESDRVLQFAPGSSSGTVVAGGNGRGSDLHQLNRPSSVYVDSKGMVYVSDQYNHRIVAWNPGATAGIVVAGGNGPGSGNHQLNEPYGVCLNSQGQLIISDQQNHRVVRWSPGSYSGTRILGITGLQGMGADLLNSPQGLFLDSKGCLYIVDKNNHRIQRWIPGTIFSQTVAGGNGQGSQLNQLNYPSDVFVDAYGGIYVTDYNNNRVVMWSSGTDMGQSILGSNFVNSPRGVSIDEIGNLYVMNDGWASLRSYSKESLTEKNFIPTWGGKYTAKILTHGGCMVEVSNYAGIPNYVVALSNREHEACFGDTVRLTSIQEVGFSYQWQRNGIDIPGATGLNYEAVQEGNYRLKATGGVGCSFSRETSIRPLPYASLVAAVNPGCSPGVLSISSLDDNIAGINWFRDGVFQHRWEAQYNLTTYSNSGFNSPHGVYIDKSGNVFIADLENDRVLRRDVVSGALQIVAGGNGRGAALNQLNRPVMVFVDEFGWIYVSDMGNHRVMKWAQGGTSGQIVAGGNGPGSMLNQLNSPHGIVLDSYGGLIIADHSNNRIMRWLNGGLEGTVVAGGQGAGSLPNQLYGPAGLCISNSGTIYISDYSNNRIQAWHPGSTAGITVATGNQPWGLALDPAGALYFTSRANHHVVQWRKGARSGRVVVGSNGAFNVVGSLNDPTGLWVDSKGGLCVAERGFGSIHYVKPENLSGKPYQTMAAGTYTAKLYTYGGCEGDVQGQVNFVPQARISAIQNGEECSGDTLVLTAQQQQGLFYQWQRDGLDMPGETGVEIRTVLPGSYRLMVVNPQGCTTTSEDYVLRPTPSFGVSTLAECPNDTPGVQLAITGNDSILSGIAWLRNGIVHNYYDAKYTQVLQQVYQVPSMYHPWYGWVSNLNSPQGIHIDREGNLYVADTEFDRIVKWSPNGGQGVVVAGGNGRGAGLTQLDRPLGVFVDERGWIYVSDQGNHRVVRWIQGQGVGMVVAGGRGHGINLNQLSSPHGIWVNGTGDVFVSDHGNHRVVKWIPGADTGSVVAGGNGPGSMPNQLNYPAGICMNQAGELFVADQYNHRVQRWSIGAPNGVTVAGGNGQGVRSNQLSHPWDVSVLGSGSVYISDRGNHRVMLWRTGSINGQVVGGYNGYGNSAGQLNDPSGIRIDRQGNLFIAERGQQWVQSLAHEPLTSMTFSTSDAGLYTAKAYTKEGCLVDGNQCGLLVKVTPSSSNVVCEGQPTVLTGDSIPGCTYQWIKDGVHLLGATTRFLMAQSSGSYRLMVSHSSGCTAQSCAIPVLVNPSASVRSMGNLCIPSSVHLSTASLLDTNVVSVHWIKGNGEVGQNQRVYDPLGNLEMINYSYPNELAFGRNGKDLYFSQSQVHRIVKKNLETGTFEVVIGDWGGGGGLNQLNYPLGVFVQRQGEIYVADHNNHRIMRFEAGSTTGTVVAGGAGAGSGLNQLNGPYGIFVDPRYNVYVADYYNHRIQRWAPGSTVGVTVAGGNGSGGGLHQLNNPTNMVIGPDGSMYIVDKGNNRILKWELGANNGVIVAGGQGAGAAGLNQLNGPHGIQVDAAGTMYISDHSNHCIMRWRPGSTIGEIIAGGLGAGSAVAQLHNPQGIGLSTGGELYVADYDNHRIVRFESMGMDTASFRPTESGLYSAKVFYRNGCNNQTNTIRIGSDTTDFGNQPFVVQNDFSQNSSGWNTNQRFGYLGNQTLGPFANQSLSYFNQNLPPYDTAFVEFDWNIHDSWDNTEPFFVTANGQLLGSFYFWTWGTASYPQLEPLGQFGSRCSGYPTRAYRARFAVPNAGANALSFSINQWNAEDVCNESWSIDNFKVTAGSSVTICQGDTAWMGSIPLFRAGLQYLNLSNQLGCDSVIKAYVQVKPRPNAVNLNAQICANTTYLFGNQSLNQSGTYTRTIPSFNGCDSVINLQLLVNPIYSLETTSRLCHGETYQFNGTSLSQSGTYTATLVSQNGCDSLVTLNLLVGDSVMPTYLNQTICQGDTLNIQGQLFWQTGTYTAVLNNQLGCDSLLYLNLQVANPSFTVLYDTLSFGSYYELGNSVLNTAGVYSLLLNNISGCDSSVTLHLFVLNSPIRGILRYQNQSLTPMGNVMLNLLSGNQTVSNVTTDAQGFFDFGIHPAGNYQLRFTNPRPWGGVNATDALGISRYFTNLLSLSGLRRQVADVNLTASVNSSDALLVSKRYSLIINDFSSGDFAYSLDTFSIGQGDSVYLDLRSLCYGDVNASFNPSVTARSSWTTIADEDEILTSSGSYFVDVKTSRVIDLGAVSLNLRLPEGVEVVSVRSMSKVSDEPVVYNQIGRNLRLAWYHLMPWRLMEGDDVIRLELKGRAEGWLELDEIESELANSDGVALSGLPLTAARLRLQSSKTPLEASIFPNPASNRSSLNLIIGQPSTLNVEVVDAIGRRVYQSHDPMLTAGEHRMELPMDEWSDGQYYVLVQALSGDGQVLKQSLKLQKKR